MNFLAPPWRAQDPNPRRFNNIGIMCSDPTIFIAEVFGHGSNDGHGEKNAQLIAASPRMHQAIGIALDILQQHSETGFSVSVNLGLTELTDMLRTVYAHANGAASDDQVVAAIAEAEKTIAP